MKKTAIRHSLYLFAFFAFFSFAPMTAQAGSCLCQGKTTPVDADTQQACDTMCGGTGAFTSSSPAAGGSSGGTQTKGLENPLSNICGGKTGQTCVQLVIGNVIRAALGISGSIALLMMTWGGFLWLSSMGNSERVEKGKSTLIWATLGLALIFGAYALTSYIIRAISGG